MPPTEVVVISDSDVRVRPDYLRHVVAPLRDPKVGAVTCLYVPIEITTFTDHLQSVGMINPTSTQAFWWTGNWRA